MMKPMSRIHVCRFKIRGPTRLRHRLIVFRKLIRQVYSQWTDYHQYLWMSNNPISELPNLTGLDVYRPDLLEDMAVICREIGRRLNENPDISITPKKKKRVLLRKLPNINMYKYLIIPEYKYHIYEAAYLKIK